MFPVSSVTYLPGLYLARWLTRPFNYIELRRIREAFQANLTVPPETEPLTGTQL